PACPRPDGVPAGSDLPFPVQPRKPPDKYFRRVSDPNNRNGKQSTAHLERRLVPIHPSYRFETIAASLPPDVPDRSHPAATSRDRGPCSPPPVQKPDVYHRETGNTARDQSYLPSTSVTSGSI